MKVEIFIIKPSGYNNSASGNRHKDVVRILHRLFDLHIFEKNSYQKKNKLKKIIYGLFLRVNLGFMALKVPKSTKDSKNIIVLFSINTLSALIIKFINIFKGNKLVIERNEYPAPIRNKNKLKKLFYKLFILSWQYRLYDGLFLMTDNLIQFYKKYTRNNCVIQKFPMTVNFDRFKDIDEPFDEEHYIAYTGSLSNDKDGILYLLNAFNSIAEEYKDVKLKIAGGKNEQINNLTKYVKELNLIDRVQFLGLISGEKIPELIKNAMILVLPRPDSLQARGGFPTKLGEYLASGNPVIVTNVGEIPKLVKQDEVYFIDKDNIEKELVRTFQAIISNYDIAKAIGKKGKKRAYETFSLEANSHKVANLIYEVAKI